MPTPHRSLISITIILFVLLAACTPTDNKSLSTNTNNEAVDKLIADSKSLMLTKPDSAIVLLTEALSFAPHQISTSQQCDAYTQMGVAYSMQKKMDISDSIYNQALTVLAIEDDSLKRSSLYINLGINRSKLGDFKEAIKYYLLAENLASKHHEGRNNISRIANNLGIAYAATGIIDSARHYYQQTLEMALRSSDKKMEANALINLSTILHRYKEYNQAEQNLKRAAMLYGEEQNLAGVLNANMNLAIVLRSLKKDDEALETYYKSEQIANTMGMTAALGVIYHNEGDLYFAKREYKKSLELLQKALAVKYQNRDSVSMAYSLNSMGVIFNKTGDYNRSEAYSLKAKRIGERASHADLLLNVYTNLSSTFAAKGQWDEAMKYVDLRDGLKDSLFVKQKFEALQEVLTKYETEKKELEIQQLTEQNKYQKKIRFLFIGIIILLGTTLLGILYLSKIKRKATLDKLEVERLKKEEAQLELKLKEEQVVRSELDKYEALLEVRFKELEIDGKEQELAVLKADKHELDKQIQKYSLNLNRYERQVDEIRELQKGRSYALLADEVKLLISKKQNNKENAYTRRVDALSDSFIMQIEKLSKYSISTIYIKYCICFAIDMDVKDVSDCFSVEQSTIHMVRYRLKKKFDLVNNDDLNMYLKNLVLKSKEDLL